jgi:Divergent InlB B-repeat domain
MEIKRLAGWVGMGAGKRRARAVVWLIAMAVCALTAANASAKTFIADPAIADTITPSACASPCSLRQAVMAAQTAEEEEVNSFAAASNTIELEPGAYELTQGTLRLEHPYVSLTEEPLTLAGRAGKADETVITAEGKSRVIVDGHESELDGQFIGGGTSGEVILKDLEVTGGNGEAKSSAESPEITNGHGGGIAVEQNGHLKLEQDLIEGNAAASSGGGIEVIGAVAIEDSTVADNTVTGGSGLGGGIASEEIGGDEEFVDLLNSTVANNTVSDGSIGSGGGVFNGTTMTITNSTIAGNSTTSGVGGGISSLNEEKVGVTTLTNTVLANNTGDCSGKPPVDDGGNIADDASCSLMQANSHQSTNPLLAQDSGKPELADNGGPTDTVYLQPTSPAIGGGVSGCPATDQRGAPRVGPSGCDAGAVEYYSRYVIGTEAKGEGSADIVPSSESAAASCGSTSCEVDGGSEVEIAVTPAAGYELQGWSGGSCKGTENPCAISDVLTSEKDAAQIAKSATHYTVTGGLLSLHGGSITASSPSTGAVCSGDGCSVKAGATVELKVHPAAGYTFTGWEGEPGESCQGTENPCVIHGVTKSETDFADIAAPRYVVSGSIGAGEGTVTATSKSSESECAGYKCTIYEGGRVELTVDPGAGYAFNGWSGGSCKGTENPCVIDDVGANETDTATMVKRFTVTGELGPSQNQLGYIKMSSDSSSPNCAYDEEHLKNFEGFEEGTIILSGGCTVDAESDVTLEYVNYGVYHFYVASWSGGSCKAAENPCVVDNVQADETNVAVISDASHESGLAVKGVIAAGTGTITATSPSTGGSCTAATCKVPPGSNVDLAVTPVAGGTFTGWSGGSCKGTENPCVLSNVQAAETDTATVRPPITASLSEITGPSVEHVSQYSENYGLQSYYDAQNGSTIELHAVINDDDVAGSYEITYTAQFGGCNGSYADSGTLGPFTLPASNGDQDVAVPLALTGAHSYPGDAKISYGLVATRNDGYSVKAASSYFDVGPVGISSSNYNPYAVESGSVINRTATTATMTANVYFADQSQQYEQNLKEPATAVTPAVEGNGSAFAAEEIYDGAKPPADAVWLGFTTHAQGGGLAFLGGANESFPSPEYGIFQLGTGKADAGDFTEGPDDTLQRCFLHPGVSAEEAPQIVRDVATGLQPDTVYHFRLAQTFAEGICPFKHDEGLEDCLDSHSGTPTYVPYVGGFPAAEGFGGSAGPYAGAWNPIFGPEEQFTTAATEEPTPPVVDTTTGEGTTTISCPARKGFCVGSFSLYEEVIPHKKASIAKTATSKLVLLTNNHFKIPAHRKQKIHFRLSSSRRKYLLGHRHGKFVDKVTARIGDRKLSTAEYDVKLRT